MQKKAFIVLLAVLLIGGCKPNESASKSNQEPVRELLSTEKFLQKYLLKADGRMQTNMTDRQEEYLSESLGLWMGYLLLKNDQEQFSQQVEVLKSHFLAKNGLVTWEIKNTEKSTVNAFIDDLRIVTALYEAGEYWRESTYTKLAEKMSKSLIRYQTKSNALVDFVDINSKEKSSEVTLSYIIPAGLNRMKTVGDLPVTTYEEMHNLLFEAPLTFESFFPLKYNLMTKQYEFEEEVNMIDQFYVGYHGAQWGKDVTALVSFAKEAFLASDGKIYGRYDSRTQEPTVTYESASVYALAILMSFEVEEIDFAKELYERMKTLRVNDETSPYYGGYMNLSTKETHTFDNLLALIAERKGKNESYF